MSSADAATNATADAAKTVCAFVAASRIPPSAGPRKIPELSTVVSTRFAAVSSSGVFASCGRSADCIGRTVLAISATPPLSAYTSQFDPPAKRTSAVAAMKPARMNERTTSRSSRR